MAGSRGAQEVAELIARAGPLRFDRYMEIALYGEDGFFAGGAGAGRAGQDFLTSPEVGPLFGRLLAKALDAWWHELGSPDPYAVVEAGAGRGQLARCVLRARPSCGRALRYVLVETSEALRGAQRDHLPIEPAEEVLGPVDGGDADLAPATVPGMGPIVACLAELPAGPLTGVVFANELLDNLPFRIVERTVEGWDEILVGLGPGGDLAEVHVRADDWLAHEVEDVVGSVPVGSRLPAQVGIDPWLRSCAAVLQRGFIVLVDYAASFEELARRQQQGWLRTYRAHERGTDPLQATGSQDITADVAREWLVRAAQRAGLQLVAEQSQAAWLGSLDLDALLDQARATWRERAHVGDLEALEARSAASEAEALTDPQGLGAHSVFILRR